MTEFRKEGAPKPLTPDEVDSFLAAKEAQLEGADQATLGAIKAEIDEILGRYSNEVASAVGDLDGLNYGLNPDQHPGSEEHVDRFGDAIARANALRAKIDRKTKGL